MRIGSFPDHTVGQARTQQHETCDVKCKAARLSQALPLQDAVLIGGHACVQGHQGNGAGNNLLQGQYDNSWQLGQEERMDTAEHAWMQQV